MAETVLQNLFHAAPRQAYRIPGILSFDNESDRYVEVTIAVFEPDYPAQIASLKEEIENLVDQLLEEDEEIE